MSQKSKLINTLRRIEDSQRSMASIRKCRWTKNKKIEKLILNNNRLREWKTYTENREKIDHASTTNYSFKDAR